MLSRSELTARAETFILAGGQGKRLYPLTRDRAKPVVSLGGVYKLIDFTLSNCLNSGLRRINILTQHHCESLHSHVRRLILDENVRLEDGAEVGLSLSCHRDVYDFVTSSGTRQFRE